MSLGDISGPLYRMPYGTTSSAQGAINGFAPAYERQKSPVYVSGATDMRGFLSSIRARVDFQPRLRGRSRCLSHEPPRVSEPQSARCDPLMGARVWIFTPLSRMMVVCVCWSRTQADMIEDVIREKLENLGICVQGVLQLRSGRFG